jgi:hypothetical protein
LIEDSGARIEWFRERIIERLDAAWTPEMALERAGHCLEYDLIFLDHDAKWNDARITFYDAALRMAQLGFSGTVVIHSLNVPGAKRMEYALGRNAKVVRMPYGTFEIEVKHGS